jgi:hypothetical protein
MKRSFVADIIDNEGRHGLSKAESAWLAGFMVYVDILSLDILAFLLFLNAVQAVLKRQVWMF